MSTPKRLWLLNDGRAGHMNQAKGLIALLEEHGQTFQVDTIDCHPRLKLANRLGTWWLNTLPPGASAHLALLGYRMSTLPSGRPDLILSAGGDTAVANAALARQLNAPNLFIGSRRRLRPERFTLYLTLEAQGGTNNLVMPIPPSPLTPAHCRAEGSALRAAHGDAPLWAILIGGTGAGFTYTNADWDALAEGLNSLSRRFGGRWLLTTSRRTGGAVEQYLRTRLHPDSLADATWYHHAPRKVMAAYLGAADAILCTADSMSMLADGLNAGKAVTSLWPVQAQPDAQYVQALDRLALCLPLSQCSLHDLAFSNPKAFSEEEMARETPLLELRSHLADDVIRRLWT